MMVISCVLARCMVFILLCLAFAANERTFLAWLSMAVTIGSVSAALVGFTATEKKGARLQRTLSHTQSPC